MYINHKYLPRVKFLRNIISLFNILYAYTNM